MPDSTAPTGQGPRTRVRPYRYQDADEFAALVRGAGFRYEGHSPDFLRVDGDWRDHERRAITAGMVRDTTPGGLSGPSG
ncbi:hypothetical protein [Streptomyces niveus]|uniref:Uncharacterized protein n=1 Tax=Streptomyces niveus TaxID=193462 RepID=A0ABZ2AJW9_STRNV|nr:hypothetical protein [Streptomyces niveus]